MFMLCVLVSITLKDVCLLCQSVEMFAFDLVHFLCLLVCWACAVYAGGAVKRAQEGMFGSVSGHAAVISRDVRQG